jgi:hypothetical protein
MLFGPLTVNKYSEKKFDGKQLRGLKIFDLLKILDNMDDTDLYKSHLRNY